MAAYTSLQAFVAYGQLYDLWWNPPKDSLDLELQELTSETCHEQAALDHSNTEKVCPLEETAVEVKSFSKEHGNVSGSESDFAISPGLLTKRQGKLKGCRVLLSEEYAAIQSTQRDISRVQATVAAMISLHQKNNLNKQEFEADLEKPLSPPIQNQSKQVKEPVSLPHLMKQLTEANQQLAEFPDSIKASPFPDVLECCLVVLHMGVQCHMDLISELQEQSLHLLRKYGQLCIHKEICRKFLQEAPAS